MSLQPGPRLVRLAFATALGLVALLLRWQAALHLPADYDEAIYLRGAQAYAQGFRSGNLSVIFSDDSPENPPLMKLVFGAALATQVDLPAIDTDLNQPLPANLLQAARAASVMLSAAAVLVMALVSPVAGVALAVHTLHIKYASEVLLEALPFAASLLCVVAYQKSNRQWNRWLALSALALGVTASSKYLYCVVAVAILADWALHALHNSSDSRNSWKRELRNAVIWGALAVVAFVATDPYLWLDPVGRLVSSLTFHRQNSSLAVNTQKYVAWQPLVWLSSASTFRPDVLWVYLDPLVLVLAALGVVLLWRRQRVFALWLAVGLAFVLIYSNKWPQYPLVVLAPICLSAGLVVEALWHLATRPKPWREALPLLMAAPLAVAAGVWVMWLGQNWHQADPAFVAAQSAIQRSSQPDEAVVFAPANPYVELASRAPTEAAWSWNATRALAPNQAALDFHTANQWLNEAVAGKMGVWLVTYQSFAGDPADTLRTLLQRQAHLLSPAASQTFSRTYEITHFRFDAPYQPITSTAPFAAATVDAAYGKQVGLSTSGCAQLRPVATGGLLELSCLWRVSPNVRLAWDTQVSLRLSDANGQQVLQSDVMMLRSGLPTVRFDGVMLGNYFVPLPTELPPGRYQMRLFAYGKDGEYSPGITVPVTLDPP